MANTRPREAKAPNTRPREAKALESDILRDKQLPPAMPPAIRVPPRLPAIIYTVSGNQICNFLKSDRTDQITPLIRNAAETYRHSSFSGFALSLSIRTHSKDCRLKLNLNLHPTVSAISIVDVHGDFLGWQYYYFDMLDGLDEAHPFKVRLLAPPPSRPNRPPSVRVAYRGSWLSVSSFLKCYPSAIQLRDSVLQQMPRPLWDAQWRWWVALSRLPKYHKLHRTFRLLDLPAEIRDLIYSHIFPSPLHPFPASRSRKLGGIPLSRFRAAQPDIRIFQLNRQTYQEASRVLFSDTVWYTHHTPVLYKILVSPHLCARVQRLHLALSHSGFISLFTHEDASDNACLKPLRTMSLRSLVLDIAPPARYARWDGTETRPPCQKLMVEWILKAAEFWAVGHRGVKVVGCVKAWQKRNFEALCREWLKNFELWKELEGNEGLELAEWDAYRAAWDALGEEEDEGGVRVVEEADERSAGNPEGRDVDWIETRTLADYVGGMGNLPPPECFCEVSCDVENWSPED